MDNAAYGSGPVLSWAVRQPGQRISAITTTLLRDLVLLRAAFILLFFLSRPNPASCRPLY